MDAITATVLLKCLDGLSARSTAIAQNIANAQTSGYQPVKVTFEEALAAAADNGVEALDAFRPQFRTEPLPAGETLRLDMEMAEASATAGRYGALVELLNRQAQIAALAVSGGR